jgi:hypothetical protein
MELILPYNGSGVFLRVRNWVNDAASNIRIRADRHDSEDDNFAQGLTQCITKDGQTSITANLPMSGFRHINVGLATAVTSYARYDQMQLGKAVWADAGGTADAITATYSPNTVTPIDGQLYYVRASAANTIATPTFSPDGETASIIVKSGNIPLEAGDIFGDGHELILRYRLSDTKYELLNPSRPPNYTGQNTITTLGTITTGVWNGTDIAIDDGGTGASTALDGFNNLKQAATDSYAGVVELATTAELETGTDATRAVTPAAVLGAIGFSNYYESPQQTITAAGSLTLAHGLGRKPILTKFVLQCTTADGGYSIGDEAAEILPGFNTSNTGVSVVCDATNINVRYGSAAQVFVALRKDTGVSFNLTPANWRFVIRAWA